MARILGPLKAASIRAVKARPKRRRSGSTRPSVVRHIANHRELPQGWRQILDQEVSSCARGILTRWSEWNRHPWRASQYCCPAHGKFHRPRPRLTRVSARIPSSSGCGCCEPSTRALGCTALSIFPYLPLFPPSPQFHLRPCGFVRLNGTPIERPRQLSNSRVFHLRPAGIRCRTPGYGCFITDFILN
jgi:hypothetical protein